MFVYRIKRQESDKFERELKPLNRKHTHAYKATENTYAHILKVLKKIKTFERNSFSL